MKEANITIKLYSYEELNEVAQEIAFDEHYDFLCSVGDIRHFNKQEEVKEFIEESIKINEYLFFSDGSMANTTHYTGKHPKAGIMEFKFKDVVVELQSST